MKYFFFLTISILIVSCSSQQDLGTRVLHQKPKIYLDEYGNKLKENEFQERWRNKENNLTRWDYGTSDSGRVAKLVGPIYSRHFATYSDLKEKLQILTGRNFPDDATFLLDYTYKDDLCSESFPNNWNKAQIKRRKSFTSEWKTSIEKEYDNVIVFHFFEEGIPLKNDIASPDEYYFQDLKNFLKSNMFLTPSLCGSIALIKPGGQILVRNGEYPTEFMAQHLRPENWKLFFPQE
ncbi:hypothetical protein LZ575_09975 [Antarcticibacterium sp. 1MA-6-2]|uniref:hypothetical protein n=1 Tax=Antarcticibacterium sp. 1MA-6-2 TaxID=2908210 RepID=UPI001F404509|nr:hypothetical protein [Antarcticibacterium sp. 1MA-6-2]UJH92740.1 hypothetical protein LZ575_09975 [Antarcticibacterium sp. 1MA-6-2]